ANEFAPTQGAQSSLPGYEWCLTGRVCSAAGGFFSKKTWRSESDRSLLTPVPSISSKVAASLGLEPRLRAITYEKIRGRTESLGRSQNSLPEMPFSALETGPGTPLVVPTGGAHSPPEVSPSFQTAANEHRALYDEELPPRD